MVERLVLADYPFIFSQNFDLDEGFGELYFPNPYPHKRFFSSKTQNTRITIRNCHIAKSLYYGIYFMNNGEAVLEGNTFVDCDSGETNKP